MRLQNQAANADEALALALPELGGARRTPQIRTSKASMRTWCGSEAIRPVAEHGVWFIGKRTKTRTGPKWKHSISATVKR